VEERNQNIVCGSLVAVKKDIFSLDCFLGLVVNQEAGREWADKDSLFKLVPTENGHVLVRVLGLLNLENGWKVCDSKLPSKEPSGREIVRWALVSTCFCSVVAGPDLKSISEFRDLCRVCNSLWSGSTFIGDLNLIVGYLTRESRIAEASNDYEKKYFAMLQEVLPRW